MSRNELQKRCDEQQKQLLIYEKKLKDVIRAYKGLAAEKEALQSTVAALTTGGDDEQLTGDEEPAAEVQPGQQVNEPLEDNLDTASNAGSASTTTGDGMQLKRMQTLKRAIATLTQEKSRREAAFQADKKMLLAENDALREREFTARAEGEAKAKLLEQQANELRARLRQMDGDRERELTDHGAVLAEMQTRYGKERANCEQMERQIAELYRKLLDANEQPEMHEAQLSELRITISTLKSQLADAERRAAMTPTLSSLTQQLADAKNQHERELVAVRARASASSAGQVERESRADQLEARIAELALEMGEYERRKVADTEKLELMTARLVQLESENRALVETLNQANAERDGDEMVIIKRIRALRDQLRHRRPGVNVYEVLELEAPTTADRDRYLALADEFERYKLKAAAVLKNLTEKEKSESLHPKKHSDDSIDSTTNENIDHMKTVIATLHERLQMVEHDRAILEKASQENLSTLRHTIAQMQLTHERALSDARNQTEQQLHEVEMEMQKQRVRTLEVLAEKERELDMTKTILLAVRGQEPRTTIRVQSPTATGWNHSDPIDPPQKLTKEGRMVKAASPNYNINTGGDNVHRKLSRNTTSGETLNPIGDGAGTASLSIAELDEYKSSHSFSRAESYSSAVTAVADDLESGNVNGNTVLTLPGGGESRNVFYEQQLWKREQDINELRMAVRTAESNMRDIQQSSLTKDLQHYETIEKLKDEIRILEGKIRLFGEGGANLEYLRNVFVQLMLCDSVAGRKHIVKAIGSVLKLSANEMKALEAKHF